MRAFKIYRNKWMCSGLKGMLLGVAAMVLCLQVTQAQEPAPKDRPRDPGRSQDIRDQPTGNVPADRDVRPPDRRGPEDQGPPPSGSFVPPGPDRNRGNRDSLPGSPRMPPNPPRDGGGRPDEGRFGPGFGPPMNRPPMDGRNFPGQNLEEMKKYDPEMYELEKTDMELERVSYDLSQQYRRSPRDQRDELKKQLQEVVQKQFDVRQSRRQLQLKRFEDELTRMRTALDRRTELRQQIVDRHLAELVGEQNDLDF